MALHGKHKKLMGEMSEYMAKRTSLSQGYPSHKLQAAMPGASAKLNKRGKAKGPVTTAPHQAAVKKRLRSAKKY